MKKSYVLITGAFLVVIALAAYYLGFSAGIDSTTQLTGAATLDVDSSAKLPWFGILALVIAGLTVVYAIFSEGTPPIQEPAQQHFHYYQSLRETNPALQEAPRIQSQMAPRTASPAINNIHKKQPPKSLFRSKVFTNFEQAYRRPVQPPPVQKPEMSPEHAEIVTKLRQMRDKGLF